MEKIRVYLDNCCFNRPYDNQTQLKIELETKAKLFIQNLVIKGRIELAWSYMLDFENSRNTYSQKAMAIQRWQSLSAIDMDETQEILTVSSEIQSTGIKPADSLHIACAICEDCDYFISTDTRVLKYSNDKIIICDPVKFLRLWEDMSDDE